MSELNNVVELILTDEESRDISLIGVAGSIGRGEKKLTDPGLNDVDIIVVKREQRLRNKNLFEDELNKMFGTRYSDIFLISEKRYLSRFGARYLSQSDYDLIRETKILYTSPPMKMALNTVSMRSGQKVMLSSAIAVLATRGWILDKEKWRENNPKLVVQQLKKFLSAIVDASLILEGVYSSAARREKILRFVETHFFRRMAESDRDAFFAVQAGKLDQDNDKLRDFCIVLLKNYSAKYFLCCRSISFVELVSSSIIFYSRCALRKSFFPFKDLIGLMRFWL